MFIKLDSRYALWFANFATLFWLFFFVWIPAAPTPDSVQPCSGAQGTAERDNDVRQLYYLCFMLALPGWHSYVAQIAAVSCLLEEPVFVES